MDFHVSVEMQLETIARSLMICKTIEVWHMTISKREITNGKLYGRKCLKHLKRGTFRWQIYG
jgi:hypothetical protein